MTLRQHRYAPKFLSHTPNEVLGNLVKNDPVRAFYSVPSSQKLCHSWPTNRLKGPVHSQYFPIKDLWGINVVWPSAHITRVSGYIKIEISPRARELKQKRIDDPNQSCVCLYSNPAQSVNCKNGELKRVYFWTVISKATRAVLQFIKGYFRDFITHFP